MSAAVITAAPIGKARSSSVVRTVRLRRRMRTVGIDGRPRTHHEVAAGPLGEEVPHVFGHHEAVSAEDEGLAEHGAGDVADPPGDLRVVVHDRRDRLPGQLCGASERIRDSVHDVLDARPH